ncbi:MAG: GTP cyclohydrolase II [Armatimonadetes bacterium]|nr:GTP cyclohydrolase II [Armatimonadota bacterium]
MERIEKAIQALQAGEFVLLADDSSPATSGDLLVAGQFVTAAAIGTMLQETRCGLVEVAASAERLEQLQLPLLASDQISASQKAVAISVDVRGLEVAPISTQGRAATIRALADPRTGPHELVRPGHVTPLQAQPGGVLKRAGHTEGAVDLARLAGLAPVVMLCPVLNAEGARAALPELELLAERQGLVIVSLAALIAYRSRTEKLIRLDAEADLPTVHGHFRVRCYTSVVDGDEYVAIVKSDVATEENVLVRVHSGCLTGDVLGSCRCDCGYQLEAALRMIDEAGLGVVVYIARHEGRGIGLANKLKAYHLQDEGYDTVEANEALGFDADLRDYGIGAQVLVDLGITTMRIMTNNPAKYVALEGYGLKITERVPLEAPPTEHSRRYLCTKKAKLGHLLTLVEGEEAGTAE